MTRVFLVACLIMAGCQNKPSNADAFGNFESEEITVSSEAPGKLLFLNVEEGQEIPARARVACVDTIQLSLKREQLLAAKRQVKSRSANVISQIEVTKEQKRVAENDLRRIQDLIKADAATQKQLDDVSGQIRVLEKQMDAIESQNSAVVAEYETIDTQIRQINDQIEKSIITNPIRGTVLLKFAQSGEIVSFGKPLYRIANLDSMYLRAYISGDQLPGVRIGQSVEVILDLNKTGNQTRSGQVTWISSRAEFTPKIIQTKEERVNMVYAIKIRVPNDGAIKIGMPGEVKFK